MAPVTQVTVPDIGDFTDVPVIEILVKPGDTVAVETPLVTLESDKATMEVPSPVAGVVKEVLVSLGDALSMGSPVVTIEASGDAPVEAATEPTPPVVDAPAPPVAPDIEPEPDPTVAAEPGQPAYASPAVRRLARERGVDLAALTGSGRKGRIVKADVESGVSAPAPTAGMPTGRALPPWPQVDFAKFGPVEREPLSRIARIAGPYLQRNWVTIPHVTHHEDADITDLEAFRKETNAAVSAQGIKLTMVALLLKACVPSLKEHPRLNASLDGDDLVLKRYYHLGFAADTPLGLVVPVIRDVDTKGILEIAGELTALSAKARDGKLSPEDMAGGTFTISSLGGIGGTGFTPIVNAPEVAILGVTRSAMKPVWDGAAFQPRLMLPLSLSYDHRAIDGAEAARFMAHLAGVLGDLRRALL